MSPRRAVLLVLVVLLLGACKEDKKLKVTGIDPSTGDFQGGTVVTFKGNRFTKDGSRRVTVFFGNDGDWEKADFIRFRGDDEFMVRAPGGEAGKTVDVLITFEPGGEIRLRQKFKYVERDMPDVGDLDTDQKKK